MNIHLVQEKRVDLRVQIGTFRRNGGGRCGIKKIVCQRTDKEYFHGSKPVFPVFRIEDRDVLKEEGLFIQVVDIVGIDDHDGDQ